MIKAVVKYILISWEGMMKQFRIFMKEGIGTVSLRNKNGQIVGILTPECPELIFNEIVFHSMGQIINGFTRMGWIGFEMLREEGVLGPAFQETNFGFPKEIEGQIKIINSDSETITVRPEVVEPSKERPARNTNPISTGPIDPGKIIVRKKIGKEDRVDG